MLPYNTSFTAPVIPSPTTYQPIPAGPTCHTCFVPPSPLPSPFYLLPCVSYAPPPLSPATPPPAGASWCVGQPRAPPSRRQASLPGLDLEEPLSAEPPDGGGSNDERDGQCRWWPDSSADVALISAGSPSPRASVCGGAPGRPSLPLELLDAELLQTIHGGLEQRGGAGGASCSGGT
jgi:hypothetical protein